MTKTVQALSAIFVLLLGACSSNPENLGILDEKVVAQRSRELRCPLADPQRCAMLSPLVDLAEQDLLAGTHHATILDIGEDSLRARLHMVRVARKRIELQNFLFRADDTGALVMHELLDAARRGVKVRVIFDQLFMVSDLEYLLELSLAHVNFEIALYNPTFKQAETSKPEFLGSMACCFRRTNQRMHNKLLMVDDIIGMTGGRNIADRYFDFDTVYNFKDREVIVYGPVAAEMRESFDYFWASQSVIPLHHLKDISERLLSNDQAKLEEFQPAERLHEMISSIADAGQMGELFVESAHRVTDVRYFFDMPHHPGHGKGREHDAEITRALYDLFETAENSIVIQSPYLIFSRAARDMFNGIRGEKPGLEMVFSTNSLAATDAWSAYSITHKRKKNYVKTLGFDIYEFKPYPHDAAVFFPRMASLIDEKAQGFESGLIPAIGESPALEMPGPRSGLHAKSIVIDGKVSMIGSHNLDPRSEGFNTENGLIIEGESFARELEALIRRDMRPENSWVVALKPRIPLLGRINGAIESISRSLPVFDIWPFSSVTTYELLPDAEPVKPGDKDFYENYQPVGSFPEVVRAGRQAQVIFVSSMMGFARPIL